MMQSRFVDDNCCCELAGLCDHCGLLASSGWDLFDGCWVWYLRVDDMKVVGVMEMEDGRYGGSGGFDCT